MSQYEILEKMKLNKSYTVKELHEEYFPNIRANTLGLSLKRLTCCRLVRREKATSKNITFFIYKRIK